MSKANLKWDRMAPLVRLFAIVWTEPDEQKVPPCVPGPAHPCLHHHLLDQHACRWALLRPPWRASSLCSGDKSYVLLFLTSTPNFAIICPIFYEQLYQHFAVKLAVSHKKGEILPRHIPPPPLTTDHLLEVLIGFSFCNLCRVSNKSSPWLFNSVSSYPEVRTAAGRVFSRGGTVQVRPVMIMGLVFISVFKKS